MPWGSDEQIHFLASSHKHTSVTQQDFLFLPHEMRSTGTLVEQVKKQHALSQPVLSAAGQTEAALLQRHSVDAPDSQERLLHPSLTGGSSHTQLLSF